MPTFGRNACATLSAIALAQVVSPAIKRLASVAAAFSADLPTRPEPMRLVCSEDAGEGPFIALVDRDAKMSFAATIEAQAKRGATAVIIANHRPDHEIFAMGGHERCSAVPAVLISKEDGLWLRQQLKKGQVLLTLGMSYNMIYLCISLYYHCIPLYITAYDAQRRTLPCGMRQRFGSSSPRST